MFPEQQVDDVLLRDEVMDVLRKFQPCSLDWKQVYTLYKQTKTNQPMTVRDLFDHFP